LLKAEVLEASDPDREGRRSIERLVGETQTAFQCNNLAGKMVNCKDNELFRQVLLNQKIRQSQEKMSFRQRKYSEPSSATDSEVESVKLLKTHSCANLLPRKKWADSVAVSKSLQRV
jgi:hypothetical protein